MQAEKSLPVGNLLQEENIMLFLRPREVEDGQSVLYSYESRSISYAIAPRLPHCALH